MSSLALALADKLLDWLTVIVILLVLGFFVVRAEIRTQLAKRIKRKKKK